MKNIARHTKRFSALFSTALAAGLLLPLSGGVAVSVLFQGTAAQAQRPAARTLDGTVTGKGGPVKGAVVHLKDTRSLAQKSYITAEDGAYHFAQLSSGTDYDVWAEAEGKKSPVKTVSSFDTKTSLTIALKVD